MSELQDDIMMEVTGVLHDAFDEKYPPSSGNYGRAEAKKLIDVIKESIKDICVSAQRMMDDTSWELDELQEELDDTAASLSDLEKEMEELTIDTEWKRMTAQFNYYAERTKVTT